MADNSGFQANEGKYRYSKMVSQDLKYGNSYWQSFRAYRGGTIGIDKFEILEGNYQKVPNYLLKVKFYLPCRLVDDKLPMQELWVFGRNRSR